MPRLGQNMKAIEDALDQETNYAHVRVGCVGIHKSSGNSSDDTAAETCPQDRCGSQSDGSSDAATTQWKADTCDDKTLVESDPQPAVRRSDKPGQRRDGTISLSSSGRELLRMTIDDEANSFSIQSCIMSHPATVCVREVGQ
jgi:hypothetical protein